jgi:hypothetical protein
VDTHTDIAAVPTILWPIAAHAVAALAGIVSSVVSVPFGVVRAMVALEITPAPCVRRRALPASLCRHICCEGQGEKDDGHGIN